MKVYLEKIGLDEIEVTQKFRDGGIDLKAIKNGINELSDLDVVKYYIQAKRYKPSSSVPIANDRELRGVMPTGYKGVQLQENFLKMPMNLPKIQVTDLLYSLMGNL